MLAEGFLRGTRSVKEPKPAIPGHGNGPLPIAFGGAGPTRLFGVCDEGAALIAAPASKPARRPAPQSGDVMRASERGWRRRARVRDGRPSARRERLDAQRSPAPRSGDTPECLDEINMSGAPRPGVVCIRKKRDVG